MKRVNIQCPYCGSRAFLRPATVVYGKKAAASDAPLYVCAHFSTCDSYVTAHKGSHLPMGTLANAQLRHQRMEARTAFNRLWKSSLMNRKQAHRWLQLKLGLPESEAHIGKFSNYRCKQVAQLCDGFYSTAAKDKSPPNIPVRKKASP